MFTTTEISIHEQRLAVKHGDENSPVVFSPFLQVIVQPIQIMIAKSLLRICFYEWLQLIEYSICLQYWRMHRLPITSRIHADGIAEPQTSSITTRYV